MASSPDGIYTPKGRRGYWISWVDAQGRRRRRKTNARTLAQARSARSAELLRVEHNKALGFAAPGLEHVSEVTTRFLSYQKARLTAKAYTREEGIVNNHLAPLFAGPVASIRRVDIQQYITKRSLEVSAHSVQKELNVLKHFLRLAVEWEIVPFNVGQGVKAPRVPAGRVRYLQITELRAVIEASPEWLRPIVALASCTGMRRSELLGLRWFDVDLVHRRVILRQTKNGDGRIVYLNESASAAIEALRLSSLVRADDLVFRLVTPERVSMAFARVCKRLSISDFRFHDLRHTAASWLRMQGADIHTVAQLLGHKDLRMAARYQHLSPAFLADAVGRLDELFAFPRHHSVTNIPRAQAEALLTA